MAKKGYKTLVYNRSQDKAGRNSLYV